MTMCSERWPSRSCTIFGWTPAARSSVAIVCRSPWTVIGRTSARLIARSKAQRTVSRWCSVPSPRSNTRSRSVQAGPSSSRRAVARAAHTVAALRRHSAGVARERLAAGAAWTDSGLVFVDELGRGLHPQRLTDLFQQASDAAGLPRIRLHDLRHTSATLALVAGVHPKIVQERLGHTTISMTLDTYSHVLAGMQHDAAAQVERLLWTAPTETGGSGPGFAQGQPS